MGQSKIQPPRLIWINSLRRKYLFSTFPRSLFDIRSAFKIAVSRPRFIIAFGKLAVGLQSQYVSGCLRPSVTGQDAFGGEGPAAHPGSPRRQTPSPSAGRCTPPTRNSMFYRNNTTPRASSPFITTFSLRFRVFPFRVNFFRSV